MRDEPIEDLQRRFVNSYFIGDYKGKPTVIYPQAFGSADDQDHYVYFVTRSGDSGQTMRMSELKLREEYPLPGLYNYPENLVAKNKQTYSPVVLFSRRPNRQWHHGLSNATCFLDTALYPIYAHCIPLIGPAQHRWTFELVNELFTPTYPDWETAWKIVREKNPYVALNRSFGLANSPLEDVVYLFRHHNIVGLATETKIEVKEPAFTQEIRDFCVRQNLKVEIIV